MSGAKAAIQEAKRLGLYKDVMEEAVEDEPLGRVKGCPKSLHARFRLKIEDVETLSDIYVLPDRNTFLKFRITRPANAVKKTEKALDSLFTAVGKLLMP